MLKCYSVLFLNVFEIRTLPSAITLAISETFICSL